MIIRLSQKICTKLKVGRLSEMSLDENPYADWSSNLFIVDRTQYIILSNTTSLYSCIFYGRDIRNDSQFIARALSTLRDHMEADGYEEIYLNQIAPTTGTVRFAKSLNRQVIGSMNELVLAASFSLESRDLSPFETGLGINDLLLSALARKEDRGYATPKSAFQRLGPPEVY
jgi:hypothetical protein